MKFNGALMPLGAIPLIGSSIGAFRNKYRDKLIFFNKTNNNLNSTTNIYSLIKNLNGNSNEIKEKNNCCWIGKINHNLTTKGNLIKNFNKKLTTISNDSQHQIKGINIFKKKSIIMRSQQSFINFSSIFQKFSKAFNLNTIFYFNLIFILFLSPHYVKCDDNEPLSNNAGPEPTSEFDYAGRGTKKFGDKCENTLECGFPGSVCDPKRKQCQCTDDLPITDHFDKCGKVVAHNESCFFTEQCESFSFQTECRDGRCTCRFGLQGVIKDGKFECAGTERPVQERYIDPAMIGVLVVMAIMFIIICVVLRLFAQARWRENRTIFNTPNPRLMNVSLLRESKLLHGQERRGSRVSIRGPSRQPSMVSLRPHSPNPSLGKRAGSRSSNSNGSVYSVRSRSNSNAQHVNNHQRKNSITSAELHEQNLIQHQLHQQQHNQHHHHPPLITHVTTNPVADSVTIEVPDTTTKLQTDI